MFVMASPLEAHLSETLTSLKFATKVCQNLYLQSFPLTKHRYTIHILERRKSPPKSAAAIDDEPTALFDYHFGVCAFIGGFTIDQINDAWILGP